MYPLESFCVFPIHGIIHMGRGPTDFIESYLYNVVRARKRDRSHPTSIMLGPPI